MEGVVRPSRRSQKGREALPEVWKGSDSLPAGPGGVEMPSRMSRRGEEALPKVREGSGGPVRNLVRVRRPSLNFRRVGRPSR